MKAGVNQRNEPWQVPSQQASPYPLVSSSPHFLVLPLLLALLCLALFFYRLEDRDLWASHEARAAQNAQALLDSGAWGLPHLYDGKPELQKPPLYYWLVAAAAWLRGQPVDAWTVRLPAALSGSAGVFLVWWMLHRQGRPLAAFLAAGILATAMHYTWLARTARIDMPLTLAVSVTLLGYYISWQAQEKGQGPGRLSLLAAYVALAAGILLKGPVAFVLPAATVALHRWWEGKLPLPWHGRQLVSTARELGLWWGLPLVLLLTAPWFIWANRETGGAFTQSFFWKHNFQRGLGGASDLAAHPWWFYLPRFAFDFLPWTPLLVLLGWLAWRHRWLMEDAEARFGLAWLGAVVGVLSLARFKRADYLLPAYPGAALLLGCLAARWRTQLALQRRWRCSADWAWPASFAAVAAGWWFYLGCVLPEQDQRLDCRPFAAEIRRHAPDNQVLFFRVENHALAFHVGKPIATLLEWENLDVWAASPETIPVILPEEVATQWPQHLASGSLELVQRSADLPRGTLARPLVLMRTRPPRAAGLAHAGTAATPADP